MSAQHRKLLLPSLLTLMLAFIGLYIVSARTNTADLPAAGPALGVAGQPELMTASAQSSASTEHSRRGRLRPQLDAALKALGDRVEKPGKERLTITGTLQRADSTQVIPFAAVYQQPGLLRFQAGQGQEFRTIIFNGRRAEKLGSSLSADEEALVEMLIYDTPEGFFNSQMDGAATSFLGSRFRADDGTTENYSGPYHDIYQVMDRVKVKGDVSQRLKLFLLNSDTQLLEFIRYQIATNGIVTDVEVRLGDWQKTQDQMVPRRLVRLENNQPVLTLTIVSVAVSPGAEDGIFTVSQ